jgi:hypothetical protein
MYPGGKGGSPENHKKGHCSDGFKQKAPAEDSAPWPQPAGLFTTGSEFHPLPFLAAVRDLYEKVVIAADAGNLGLEDEAFSIMLQQPGRIITVNGAVLFKLFGGFEVPAGDRVPDTYFVDHNGSQYLRIDALSDTDGSVAPEQ